MKRIFLDYAAGTPVDKDVIKVVSRALGAYPGNPSALHKDGVLARKALEGARLNIARLLSAHNDEIVFVSGATEGNNMAISGVVEAARKRGVENPHIIVSAIEHPSVLEVARILEARGVRVDVLPVSGSGVIDLKELRKRITKDTVLVSVMYVNNEIGTIEPIREIAKEVRHARKVHSSVYPYFHTDAAQAGNYCELNVEKLGVDLMTLSSGKVHGPRGIGALFVRRGVLVNPILFGGDHEVGRRPGTESLALAIGFAEALTRADHIRVREIKRVEKLRERLVTLLDKKIPEILYNTELAVSSPHILNISVPGFDSESLVLYMDAKGVAVSGKSACASSTSEVSHVIVAIGKAESGEVGSVRFSLGRDTKISDLARAVQSLAQAREILGSVR